ncbi:MAG: SusD/RagB family nutrient-binding outer membrane lipoprotein [Muribaculaceae bacterium]|nr:SusD/RagB family nutrient-binding outer membrane lipoprotein [Muribaculaceae bacterium]
MKFYKSLILCGMGLAALSLTSCNDYLDINTDPNTPSAESTPYEMRLAHIEFYTNSAQQFAAWRNSMACGDWTRAASNGGTYYNMSIWYPTASITTSPYQWWFVGAYANIPDMYKKALDAGNNQYAGVAQIIRAYGMMMMTDLYGEMPFYAVEQENPLPAYNTGKEIYKLCIETLEEGITLLEGAKTLPEGMPALSEGDFWNNGDVNKWIKLGYLLKARWLVKLTKKGEGSYKDLKYDPTEILACLDKAMQSNADNTIIRHTDDNGTTHDNLGWDEPVDYSPLFSVCGMNAGYMATKMLEDNLTNFGGYGVEDPRADRILPWAYSFKTAESPADLKWDGNWRRTKGVDMSSEIQSQGGPIRASWGIVNDKQADGTYKQRRNSRDAFWIDSDNTDRYGDTIYVEETSDCTGYFANPSIMYHRGGTTKPASRESGSYYTRVSSPTYVGTYAECCFIRAEVLFNQGNKAGAFDAYKKGIQASMDQMNVILNDWCKLKDAYTLSEVPSFRPMTAAEMTNFLNNGIGTAGDITLGHIMTQKRIAMHHSLENWNDMRRYDYNPNIFFNWKRPARQQYVASAMQAIPADKQFRRWQQCSHELNYNAKQLQAIGTQVPGAVMQDSQGKETAWNKALDVWTIPVWWDSTQE